MNNCAFCKADKKHFQVQPQAKHYEMPSGKMVSTNINVMQCLSCKTRWIRHAEIEEAIYDK